MKRFLAYIFSLVIALILILVILDITYTQVYRNGLPRNKISYLMSLEGKKIDYIFIGSSRVDNTIDASVIEQHTGKKALNLGVQSAKPSDYLLMLKLIDQLDIKNEKIFIQIDHTFNLEDNSKIMNSFLMPYTENKIIQEHLKNSVSDYWQISNLPFYRYLKYDYKIGFREVFSTGIQKSTKVDFKNGYYPKYGQSGADLKGNLSRVIATKNAYVDAIRKFSSQKSIDIVYFTAPFCPETENLDFIKKLGSKLPGLWDYSTLFHKETYFYDCNHLNDKGANIFSSTIAQKINSL